MATLKSPDYASSAYLIYSCFETSKRICGSVLMDCAMTVEEAEEKIRVLKKRGEDFNAKYPILKDGTPKSIIYVTNQPHWWSGWRVC